MSFIHLHNHSDYSLLDGASKVGDLTAEAARLGMPAIALTDHGNMAGAVDFYSAAKKVGIKPIIGCELYLTDGKHTEKGADLYGNKRPIYHLLLLLKNKAGWNNLIKLSTAGYRDGFHYRPRVDYELMNQHREGIICLSGCIQSHLNQTFLKKGEKEALKVAGLLQDLYGEDFYIELQNHGIDEELHVMKFLTGLSKKIGVKMVATNDTHYLKKEHADPHDILLCVQTRSDRNDPNRFKFTGQEFYLKTEEEMRALFSEVPEALSNTLEVAEKVEFEMDFGNKHFPEFKLPEDAEVSDDFEYLKQLAYRDLPRRYPEVTEEIRKRLETELDIIKLKGLASYFLIVQDFIAFAKREKIPVGPGRGSAAGSLVSYLVGITNIDPIRYGLLFERFINPERESLPDIDVDFSDSRRSEVIEYVRKKYGEDCVGQIITFGRMLSRQVVKDVGRVMGIPLPEVEAISKLIPDPQQGKVPPLSKVLEEVKELRDLVNSRREYQELMDKALVLEGTIRNAGVHAAGVVITPEPIDNLVPMYRASDGNMVTQFDMTNVEKLGLLKMDFLGLKTLTILEQSLTLLRKRGIDIDLDALPMNDAETFEFFSRGDTIGIFQFESGGMRDNLRRLKPERLEDLIAMNALYRPGPMANIPDYIDRKHGRQKITYLHPKLSEILDETYGIIVYQEQVMQIANRLAGMSLGRADELRRAMGKKKKDVMARMMPEFINGCAKNGINKNSAKQLWDLIEKFARYGFNKSHSAGYALLAYQTGYLKTHHPAEFMAASMTVRKDNTNELVLFLEECKRMGVEVLAPDVNTSEEEFAVIDGGKVTFGLAAIKGVGSAAIQNILGERETGGPFSSIFDLAGRINGQMVNKKVLECLVRAGATDSLPGHRNQQLEALEAAINYGQQLARERANGQVSIFGEESGGMDLPRPEMPVVAEVSAHELLAWERELLGFYFSGHPLMRFHREITSFSNITVADLPGAGDNTNVRMAGLFASLERRTTRKGDPMMRGKFEDLTGTVGIVIFPTVYERLREVLREIGQHPVLISARVQRREEDVELIVEEVERLDFAAQRLTRAVQFIVDEAIAGQELLALENDLRRNPGVANVRVLFRSDDGELWTFSSGRYRINPKREILDTVEKRLGEGSVRLESVV
ncbi:MAG: DNA polymerase III subunit alpha [bacterium]